MQIASLDYSNFVGRIAIGRVFRGDIEEGQRLYAMQAEECFQKDPDKGIVHF